MGKGEVEIILKKEGSKDIKVKCPRTIRQSSVVAAMPLAWGNPPFRVRPIDVKGVVAGYARFIGVFVACFFFLVSVMLGIIALAGMVALNFVCTKNYFFNFIKKRLAEGYSPENEEQRSILEAAGLFAGNSSASSSSFVSAPSSATHSTVDAAAQLEKLASLVEKGLMTKEEFDAQKAKLLGL